MSVPADLPTLREMLDQVAPHVVAAGRWIRARAEENASGGLQLDVSSKSSPADYVTEVDIEVERRLVSLLAGHFPGHGFLGEEGTSRRLKAEYVWVLDPLDGTRNFINSYGGYCVSLGLLHNGRPVIGLVYDIVADELYTAIRGAGAYCNGRRLSVSANTRPDLCTIGVGFTPAARGDEAQVARYLRLLHGTAALRQSGSVALELANVARGSLDGFWQPELSAWDVAAGWLLVEEAGGHIKLLHDGEDWLSASPLGMFASNAGARENLTGLVFQA